ncbi:FAD/NAD(P)-binding domain-containing protein [Ceraceosorus guamensis]|uniref:NADH:ubiquinone reductase (non-electrogenic) n=1 Tax=Ceraceosorus guamensis TaxID=1522189 RepID=A0A316VSB3_9BASI|nr:FAD/NAD(P)-binding domain-containing protein [Ceraceosorus guamensis]PWN40104.1 FAD/NAD(P)-binding domain-containing protein [Ceraceosorus guamensis]
MFASSTLRVATHQCALRAHSARRAGAGAAADVIIPRVCKQAARVAPPLGSSQRSFWGASSAVAAAASASASAAAAAAQNPLLETPTAKAAAQQVRFQPGPAAAAAAASAASSSSSSPPTPPPSPPPPPPPPRAGFFKRLRRWTYLTLLLGAGTLAYYVHESNHPPDQQLPLDPTKKTIVVLGSGWGATALLKEIDNLEYNVIVISKENYFLYTPLLPQVTVGTVSPRSIAQPTRHNTRYKTREVQVLEAEATKINVKDKTVTFEDRNSEIYGANNGSETTVKYDYLVVAVGSQNQTFNIPGIKEHAFFLKELQDASKIRQRIMDLIEKASLVGQSDEEMDRLLHICVVGGGPTGVEAAAEMHDFVDDLSKWYPAVANRVRVTLVEALPQILPAFSKGLVEYTESTFKSNKIDILAKHMVKGLDEKSVTMQGPEGIVNLPCGMLIWAAGNTSRPISRDLQAQLKETQTERRGLKVDEQLRLIGAEDSIFAVGDATATQWAPTAQAASQQGSYIAKIFAQLAHADQLAQKASEALRAGRPSDEVEKLQKRADRAAKLPPFKFTNNGSLAYIGGERAIADVPLSNGASISASGTATYLFWRSAYLSMLFSLRNRTQVAADWVKVWLFGRDITRE